MSDLIDGRKCEHCGEYADDLASARLSDRHAPDFCGDCRAAMFTPRDLIDALTRAGIAASWQVAGDGDAVVSCAGGAVVIRESAGGWTLHDEDIRCAVVACEYAAADGTPAESWLEDVDDVVALVHALTGGADDDAAHTHDTCGSCGEIKPVSDLHDQTRVGFDPAGVATCTACLIAEGGQA